MATCLSLCRPPQLQAVVLEVALRVAPLVVEEVALVVVLAPVLEHAWKVVS